VKGKKIGNRWVLRLDKGDEIIESLTNFLKDNKIVSGYLTGIGATNDVKIGLFNTKDKRYITKTLKGDYEITSLMGNISLQNGEIKLHLHITIADEELKAYGGHLYFAKISAVCEIFIEEFPEILKRKEDIKTGLNLLEF
jgi:predicted DNA-binding protein with PD1-like motif